MPAQVSTEEITMHKKPLATFSRARSHPEWRGGWPSLRKEYAQIACKKAKRFQEICFTLISGELHMNSPSRYCMQFARRAKASIINSCSRIAATQRSWSTWLASLGGGYPPKAGVPKCVLAKGEGFRAGWRRAVWWKRRSLIQTSSSLQTF